MQKYIFKIHYTILLVTIVNKFPCIAIRKETEIFFSIWVSNNKCYSSKKKFQTAFLMLYSLEKKDI